MARQGLVIVHTGDGKGKTTAALGTALRMAGYRRRVLFLQFVKGTWRYGEMESLARLPEIELVRAGAGFYKILDDRHPEEVHRRAAAEGMRLAREKLTSGEYALVVLDEINYALSAGLVELSEVLELLDLRPLGLHLILTGRGAPPEIVERADLVTEMREVKHPFRSGILAQKGIDY